jgi:BirA family biotin operon repressor/biotin-[acetyl-CoA-carboxylase] ligase
VTGRPFLSRQEHFPLVGSTNDVVRGWLADGTPEVCLAVADEQSAGRGRDGRSWQAPSGAALLASLGFRPTWLPAEQAWRLAAVTSLAMAEAAEDVAGLPPGTIRLKWPNDLIVERDGRALKVAGVLGETDGLGTDDPRVVVGIGINADWAAREFPTALAGSMTSLREIGGGRPIDRTRLLEAFTDRLEARVDTLRDGRFDGAGWAGRQATTGRTVTIETHGGPREVVAARDVDTATGALLVEAADGTDRSIVSAEVVHVRLASAATTETRV